MDHEVPCEVYSESVRAGQQADIYRPPLEMPWTMRCPVKGTMKVQELVSK